MPTRRSAVDPAGTPTPTKQKTAKRRKVDWDAVERDYRTGKFTLRELADKHGCSHTAVAKHIKDGGWTQDLSEHIRQATNAKLTQALVSKEVAGNLLEVSKTIDAAAALNARIIEKHRTRLDRLARDADAAREKLLAMTDMVVDVREAGALVSAIESAVRTEKILIEKERQSYRLDEDDGKPQGDVPSIRVEYVGVKND